MGRGSVVTLTESAPPGQGLDKTPPQDVAAEQSVLGGMLMSKDAIADVLEVLRGTDFYRPAHEAIYEAVLDLYGRGEPADAVTVSAELRSEEHTSELQSRGHLVCRLLSAPTTAAIYPLSLHDALPIWTLRPNRASWAEC